MKNKSIRTLFMAFIVMVSLSSYIFLNTANTSTGNAESPQKIELSTAETSALPDIQVTKKLVKFAKELLPVSH